jgi:thiol-disulfide isomerase/thioredoxin
MTYLRVTDATFGRHVLDSPLPVLVVFGAPTCQASRALLATLTELAPDYRGTLRMASINAPGAPWLAEQFGVAMTPTALVIQGGEVLTRVVGYIPTSLLQLLCAQIAGGSLPPEPFWSPTEATFEDIVLLPLLDAWGFAYLRQAPSPAPARGRVDVLVYDEPGAPPLTLFENKRHLRSNEALRQAVGQASRYAAALDLHSFVVAAPAGLWIYAGRGAQAVPVRQISSLALEQQPDVVPQILRRLRA